MRGINFGEIGLNGGEKLKMVANFGQEREFVSSRHLALLSCWVGKI